MFRQSRSLALLGCALALAACGTTASDQPIASNCEDPGNECMSKPQPLEKIDAVDIMLVVDNSESISPKLEKLKEQLPRMMNAIVNGGEGDASFPPAASVHVAVASTDLGAHTEGIMGCKGLGDDGVFVRPGMADLSCEKSYPGYLAFDGKGAAVATVDTVACVPTLGTEGCGFEQPLEAGLKALWPASDSQITFLTNMDGAGATGHGEDENAGFLRKDSLLVIIVVEDEDDCSTGDPHVFIPEFGLDPENPDDAVLLGQGLNVRCALNPNRLYDVDRYVNGFRALHAEHPERVIFATIAGIPTELLPSDGAAINEIEDDAERNRAYDDLLAADSMQQVIDNHDTDDPGDDMLVPSCNTEYGSAYPPVRLVQVARAFGTHGVLGSLCGDDFGDTTGMLIRTIGQRLGDAANGRTDAGAE
jgi:hypothetical protein